MERQNDIQQQFLVGTVRVQMEHNVTMLKQTTNRTKMTQIQNLVLQVISCRLKRVSEIRKKKVSRNLRDDRTFPQ